MDDLIAFLRDLLDEDEAFALATTGGGIRWCANGNNELRTLPEGHAGEEGVKSPYWFEIARTNWYVPDAVHGRDFKHLARHAPYRVLREVDAKRRIIDECERQIGPVRDSVSDIFRGMKSGSHVLRLLALPYADHPEYRDEWRP